MSFDLDAPLNPEQQTKDAALESALRGCERLQTALLNQDPAIPSYLREINEQMRQYPELVHLLTDEQIAPIYIALRSISAVEVKVAKSKTKATKGLLDDGNKLGDLL